MAAYTVEHAPQASMFSTMTVALGLEPPRPLGLVRSPFPVRVEMRTVATA